MVSEHPPALNASFLVTRKIPVTGMHCAECGLTVERELMRSEGVAEVRADPGKGRVAVRYDNSRTGFERIAGRLDELGYPARDDRWTRLRASWFRYLDENARANATSAGGNCCSDPASIHARKTKR